MITLEEYLKDPCGTLSLPYKKAKQFGTPEGITITHGKGEGEAYFRLIHRLENTENPLLPEGFALGNATYKSLAEHINGCYDGIGISLEELAGYEKRLTVVVKDAATGRIAASGIADYDPLAREGYLEWIQVAPEYRRKGLGAFLVKELLLRLKGEADFVTVSGKAQDGGGAEALYRSCGFTGRDVWFVKREES